MSMPLRAATSFFALFVGASAAMAQGAPPDDLMARVQQRLRAADINGDGYIDRQEADARLPRVAKRFDLLDTDTDGRLSAAEFKQAGDRYLQQRSR